jgi:hypothetical protein
MFAAVLSVHNALQTCKTAANLLSAFATWQGQGLHQQPDCLLLGMSA